MWAPEIRRRKLVLGNVMLIVICVLLLGYLVVALLKPEKF
jgi:K+-transporting ATPase KdpF subunit